MKFVVTKIWKDGQLLEAMTSENLPAELKPGDALHRHFIYSASVNLLRSLRAAGCPIVILPSDPKELETFKFIFDMEFK